MTQATETRPVYSFFDGEIFLVAIAPDDPKAHRDRRSDQAYWAFDTEDADGTVHGTRAARAEADVHRMWSEISSLLYQTVSSTEVDRRTPEVQVWVEQIHRNYQKRSATIE